MARILIVDDEPANIRLLSEILSDFYEILFATSGTKAISISKTANIDLILLDVMMPEMDGYEICTALKSDETTRDIPVIFISGMSEISDETRGFEAGGVDYITKPIRPAIVISRVKTHLALKEQRDFLKSLAMFDGLTGIPNRRYFDSFLDQEWRRNARNKTHLTLMLLDIDFFKPYNDNYGHVQGDQCLQKVAQILSRTFLRASDLAARYGGEEFGVILPETGTDVAMRLAKKLMANFSLAAMPHSYSSVAGYITSSAGMLTFIPSRGNPLSNIIEQVDELLYAAKEAGRNRTLHHDFETGIKKEILPDSEPNIN